MCAESVAPWSGYFQARRAAPSASPQVREVKSSQESNHVRLMSAEQHPNCWSVWKRSDLKSCGVKTQQLRQYLSERFGSELSCPARNAEQLFGTAAYMTIFEIL